MASVIVFGSMNMDLSIQSERMPQRGETILGQGFFVNAGGKGANQAVAAAKFGVPTHFIGAIGRDSFGEQIKIGLKGYGVDCDEIVSVEKVETGVAVVLRTENDNRIILSPGANTVLRKSEVDAAFDRIANAGDIFLTQLECDIPTTAAALISAHNRGLMTVLNAAPAHSLDEATWNCVDVLCVNETECEALCGVFPDGEEALSQALSALAALGPKTVIITLGERGSVALFEERIMRQKAIHVEVVDATGAGDTFIGVLVSSLLQKYAFQEAIQWASYAAALATTRSGAQQSIPTFEDIERLMSGGGMG